MVRLIKREQLRLVALALTHTDDSRNQTQANQVNRFFHGPSRTVG